MMDLLLCGAPLDNSFQKDRLELVNKGSLGRRRKPSRATIKLLLSSPNHVSPQKSSPNPIPNHTSSSNHVPPQKSSSNHPSPKTSTPVQKPIHSVNKHAVNGHAHKERKSLPNLKPLLRIDGYRDETILYRMSENGPRYMKPMYVNGKQKKMNSQEPEWISLSRKLCAKFVECHIEPNSTDSYLHEELDGVKTRQMEVSSPPQQKQKHQQPMPQQNQQRTAEKKKKVMETEIPNNQAAEPPWIHLSRKLCTKFIEEHIEYPVILQDESAEDAIAVEPNGDVRIIERIGKPKERKSKSRKESEPEWVSLSRKLRAKFIESHIDDPDTISLDNQLNASDPEETSSDSMPDASLEIVIPKKVHEIRVEAQYHDCRTRNGETPANSITYTNHPQQNNQNTILLPEKECCWEYQEMEFDQESNSGTFHESGFDEEPSTNWMRNASTREIELAKDSFSHDSLENQVLQNGGTKFIRPTQTANPQFFQNVECYNNDVTFAPHETHAGKLTNGASNGDKKVITVQFISHRDPAPLNDTKQPIPKRISEAPERPGNSSFFNLTTWEEAHYEDKNHEKNSPSPLESTRLRRELRSKSMDNICDSKEAPRRDGLCDVSSHEHQHLLNNSVLTKSNPFCKSEDFLDKIECKPAAANEFENFEIKENGADACTPTQSDSFLVRNSGADRDAREFEISQEFINSKSKEIHSECSKQSQTESRLSCDDFHGTRTTKSSVNGKLDTAKLNGFKNSNVKGVRSECSRTSQTDLHLICDDYSSTVASVSYLSGETVSATNENELNNSEVKEGTREFRKTSRDGSCSSNDVEQYSATKYCNVNGKVKGEMKSSKINVDGKEALKKGRSNSYSDRGIYQNGEPKKLNVEGKRKESENSAPSYPDDRSSVNIKKSSEISGMKKHFKCNGTLPNSSNLKSAKTSQSQMNRKEVKITNVAQCGKDSHLSDQRISTSKQRDVCENEYANIQSSFSNEPVHRDALERGSNLKKKAQSVPSVFQELPHKNPGNADEKIMSVSRNNSSGMFSNESNTKDAFPKGSPSDSYHGQKDFVSESCPVKNKSKSLLDISQKRLLNQSADDNSSFKSETKQNGSSNGVIKSKNNSPMKFQEFEFPSDIPLCAKLVSKQNGRPSTPSISSSCNRNASPCSESSHVYEDMFKETTSCPSDSETSSWTVMKNNSYYVTGRSSSMNDLDFSDSCSMSVKCDYASSCSGQSTLHSRHSSCTSSSFYVNLRDYDSHMLEPTLIRKKKSTSKSSGNGDSTKMVNSNPPTPESLRHLFTSPLSSLHSPPNRTSRLVNRLPQEPESHYYSTATAASSAFKHGFDPTPPKPKKTERSSSIKIKDIAHGIILTFRRFQNHSKSSHVSPTHYVDVSHLAESGSKTGRPDPGKSRSKKEQKEASKKKDDKNRWGLASENGKTDSDSGCPQPPSNGHRAKARRSSSDLAGKKPNLEIYNGDMQSHNLSASEKKKSKSGKKNSNARDKGKKPRSKSLDTRTIPTVSRKVQQMADGTLYLVTTVSGDTALPGVYSDSPDTSSELSSHRPVKANGESNC